MNEKRIEWRGPGTLKHGGETHQVGDRLTIADYDMEALPEGSYVEISDPGRDRKWPEAGKDREPYIPLEPEVTEPEVTEPEEEETEVLPRPTMRSRWEEVAEYARNLGITVLDGMTKRQILAEIEEEESGTRTIRYSWD